MNDQEQTQIFVDAFGNPLQVGDTVVKAGRRSSSMWIEKRTVERIANGKLYLNAANGQYVRDFSLLAKVNGAAA